MTATAGERRGLLQRIFAKHGRGKAVTLDAALGAALEAHGEWKARLIEAVIVGRSPVDPATASADHRCCFGIWLYEESGAQERRSPHYEHVRLLHARFHDLAGRILGLALSGYTDQAMYGVRYGGEFDQISAQLVTAITDWRRAAGQVQSVR